MVVDLFGIVQAVGFRPAMHQLALRYQLTGWVQNRSDRVRMSMDGPVNVIETFITDLHENIPPMARLDRITEISRTELGPDEIRADFKIIESEVGEHAEVAIPADLAMCCDCQQEILDPKDRRYGYPFTTCTRCGPRYTVINDMPYDRERTTLDLFPLCPDCQAEYDDIADRRFHAESTACPVCGPECRFEDASGDDVVTGNDAIRKTRLRLAQGAIVAVRGIGGFLLAVDARNRDAIHRLRQRKHRPDKPFAVMAVDIDTVRSICDVPNSAAELLASPRMPIVILDLKEDPQTLLPMAQLTPDATTIGAMMPTSPLHQLLFTPLEDDPIPAFEFLVMTSGNRGGEPICITNDEARERLAGIADAFLFHNREINLRNDDSLCVVRGDSNQVWRRARGYAPEPVRLSVALKRNVLAMGAELKNTIAVGRNQQVVLSPHIGDLDTLEANESQRMVSKCLPEFLKCEPDVIAVDLHPDMHATALGREIAEQRSIPLHQVQHHHAHAVSCMAEYGLTEALALIFDGTGLGTDGNIWGAELMHSTLKDFHRLATFVPVPMPGGDAAVLHPVRQLVGRWVTAGLVNKDKSDKADYTDNLENLDKLADLGISAANLGISAEELYIWIRQIQSGVNSPLCHSAGRLFDSFAVALGIAPKRITYDGQPAIRLESMARKCQTGMDNLPELPFNCMESNGLLSIDWSPVFVDLKDKTIDVRDAPKWALAVHMGIASAACKMIEFALSVSSCREVVLSGGVFMNRILSEELVKRLHQMGLKVYEHRQIPPNDGGVSLGQAIIAGS